MSVPATQALAEEYPGRSLWSDAWRVLRRNRAAVVSGAVIGFMAVLVVVGPWF
ncbi:MAG TPA: ABC transporter permease, partial [Gammaproteobacteria bacterium]|nr:ABC transporter permease [Gammaproteobacteria bacterium]